MKVSSISSRACMMECFTSTFVMGSMVPVGSSRITILGSRISTCASATRRASSGTAIAPAPTARWSAMIHAQHYDYNTFVKETEEIGAHLQKAMAKH